MKVNMMSFCSSKYDLFHQFMSIPPSGILRTHNRVATHQKVKNSLTFHWPLNSFHWPFINEKQSMFTFTLAIFAGHWKFLFIFTLFPLFVERGRRKLEESIYNKNHWPQILHVSDEECQIDCFPYFVAYFSSFPKENAFQNLEENLWTINQKTEFPDFSLTLTISKIFPDFSLTLKNFRFCLTFLWPWQPCHNGLLSS